MTRSNAEWLRLIATWLPAYSFQLNEAANELDRRSPMNENSEARAEPVADGRPTNCRFRLQDEGKPYPRSSCPACGVTISTGLGKYCTRLRPALAQSDAEPVAWHKAWLEAAQWHRRKAETFEGLAKTDPGKKAYYTCLAKEHHVCAGHMEAEVSRAPRPDASGLIEAAELADRYVDELMDDGVSSWFVTEFKKFAKELRARAADRSGK